MTSTYTIKPLEWERVQNAVQEMHIAPFGFHKAVVYRRGERWEAAIDTPPDSLDSPDQNGVIHGRRMWLFQVDSLEEGKTRVAAEFERRALQYLEPVTSHP